MKVIYTKTVLALKTLWHAATGILAEAMLVLFFILAGSLVCLIWWGIFR